mmetsp:Transcript_25552/g.63816  ORF Transcript_25552/g.63816 Transcript_25552/m.63816 type:complete len:141 (-) Transcript_25552:244-666(-)
MSGCRQEFSGGPSAGKRRQPVFFLFKQDFSVAAAASPSTVAQNRTTAAPAYEPAADLKSESVPIAACGKRKFSFGKVVSAPVSVAAAFTGPAKALPELPTRVTAIFNRWAAVIERKPAANTGFKRRICSSFHKRQDTIPT